ncbi:hypothetical protein RR48_04864 [Papilio machaon]|uniref:Osiris 10 n=1 Tax=Papilio machaon TaxID=76193 RepID=A0A0N0PER4_PAPMA|nr:hypothetical protein RR48_04864 [Papilio machaon]
MTLINKYVLLIVVLISEVIPIQIDRHDGDIIEDQLPTSQLNKCLNIKRGVEVGVCFGEELLANLNHYDETESFSLATGVSFLRDEKTPRGLGNFLDKDPLDYRSILEDASELISKRSLHWDMSGLCPGLAMRIGPTLSNGVLEFVLDPRVKDRGYQNHGELTTGRLLVRNLLVPFLLGLKFHIATLLPLLLGLVLIASKKAQILSYYHRRQYKEKSAEQTTASPITPDELRDRLERLFTSKKEIDHTREETKVRNARNYAWTPINIRHS